MKARLPIIAIISVIVIVAAGATVLFYVVQSFQNQSQTVNQSTQSSSSSAASSTTTNTSSSRVLVYYPPVVYVDILGSGASGASSYFSPSSFVLVLGVNATVQWQNQDSVTHTVTASDQFFNSGDINPGMSWSYTFTKVGTYSYACSYHPWMTGTIVVENKSST